MNKLSGAILIIVGISGDLARRKLLPALYHLIQAGELPQSLHVVGVTRREINKIDLLYTLQETLESEGEVYDPAVGTLLGNLLHIQQLNLTHESDYVKLKDYLDAHETKHKVCIPRLFYLAIPSTVFIPIVGLMKSTGLSSSCHHSTHPKILIEKPFGYDLTSARQLITALRSAFLDSNIYRIDHYLAKETVQNILTFRFRNPFFQSVWNSQSISRIVITASETLSVAERGDFYEQTGALRDLIQSHLLQLLALTTMEQPNRLSASSIHREKLRLLKAITPIAPDEVASKAFRAQYASYAAEIGRPRSNVETFAAVRLTINTERWRNVPVVLQTGKALHEKSTTITLIFKDTHTKKVTDNQLVIRLQPNEGIGLRMLVKKPGYSNEADVKEMDFSYKQNFTERHPEAYERVLLDAIKGDTTVFASSQEVLTSWKIIENIIKNWQWNTVPLLKYTEGESIQALTVKSKALKTILK